MEYKQYVTQDLAFKNGKKNRVNNDENAYEMFVTVMYWPSRQYTPNGVDKDL